MAVFNPYASNQDRRRPGDIRGARPSTGYDFFDQEEEDQDGQTIASSLMAPREAVAQGGQLRRADEQDLLEGFLRDDGKVQIDATSSDEIDPDPTEDAPTETTTPPPEEESDPDPTEAFDPQDIGQLEDEQDAEYSAVNDELDIARAQALQAAAARAGTMGLGLSGGTAALLSDVGRAQDRTRALTQADLGRTQRDETFDLWQEMAGLWGAEEDMQVDLDGDDKIGPPEDRLESEPDAPGASPIDVYSPEIAPGTVASSTDEDYAAKRARIEELGGKLDEGQSRPGEYEVWVLPGGVKVKLTAPSAVGGA